MMLMRKWVAVWVASCLATLLAGCVSPRETAVEDAPAQIGEAPADDAPPAEPDTTTALPESPPPPGDIWWAEALASNFATIDGYEVERPRPAPDALLTFGRDAAREALRQIVDDPEPRQDDELYFTHRFMAAFALAWHDLDYDHGRDVALRYLEALTTKDFTDPDTKRELYADENHVAAIYTLYQHRADEVILHRLLAISRHADGALTDLLMSVYADLAHKDTNVFLRGLSQVTPEQAAMVCTYIAWDLGGESTTPDPRWTSMEQQLDLISGDRDNPLRDTARDTLVSIRVNLG
jgi:hypothetical protein